MAVLKHRQDPSEEGELSLPCEILMGRTGLSHKSNPQITFLLQLLAMLNGLCISLCFSRTPYLDNFDSSFGLWLILPFTSLEQGA